jgi:hypothetical protein
MKIKPAVAELEADLERSSDVLAAVDEQLPDLASAISVLAQHMQAIGNAITPDDLLVELDCERDGTKSSAHLRFRCYKHRPGS